MKIMQPTASEEEDPAAAKGVARVVAVGHAGAKGLQQGAAVVDAAATAAMIKEGITKSDPIFGSIELHLTPLNHTFNYLRGPKVVVIKLKLILAPALEYVAQFFCDLHSISTHALLLFF